MAAHQVKRDSSGAIFAKTKMCSFFMKGQCTRGAACTYAHSTHEQRLNPDLVRTQMCKDFASTGHCQQGHRCRYAHHESELRVLEGRRRRRHDSGRGTFPGMSAQAHTLSDGGLQCQVASDSNVFVPALGWALIAAPATHIELDGTATSTEPATMQDFPTLLNSPPQDVNVSDSQGALVVKNTFLEFQPADIVKLRREQSAPASAHRL